MIDHIGLNVPNLEAAKSYYDVMMPSLGYEPFFATDEEFSYRPAGQKPGTTVFFYAAPLKSEYVRKHVGLEHLAFRARTRDQVDDACEGPRGRQQDPLQSPDLPAVSRELLRDLLVRSSRFSSRGRLP